MKLFIILFCSIFLFSMVSAINVPLIVSTSNYTLTTTLGSSYFIDVKILNPNTEKVLVRSGSSFASFNEFWLNSNENKTVSVLLNLNSSGSYNIKFEGFQTVSYSNPDNYNINITSGSIQPSSLIIKIGDTVNFINKAGKAISLYSLETSTININDQQQYSKTFNDIRSFSYWTTPDFLNGYIEVQNKSTTHFSELDANLPIYATVNYVFTNLDIAYLTSSSFVIPIGEFRNGNIIVKNNGSGVAFNVKLEGEWITFSQNNFNLNSGEDKNVEFVIRPYISTTNSTDKTYIKPIKITGNFPEITRDLSINIPYAVISENASSYLEYLRYLREVYCANNSITKNSILCTQDPVVEYRYINNLSEAQISVNMTYEMFRTLYNNINSVPDLLQTSNNIIKEDINDLKNNSESNSFEIQRIRMENEKNSENIESLYVFLWIVIATIGSGIFIFTFIILIRKYKFRLKDRSLRVWQ